MLDRFIDPTSRPIYRRPSKIMEDLSTKILDLPSLRSQQLVFRIFLRSFYCPYPMFFAESRRLSTIRQGKDFSNRVRRFRDLYRFNGTAFGLSTFNGQAGFESRLRAAPKTKPRSAGDRVASVDRTLTDHNDRGLPSAVLWPMIRHGPLTQEIKACR